MQNTIIVSGNTPEMNDKGKNLFEDDDDDDLFKSSAKQVKPTLESTLQGSAKKVFICDQFLLIL